MLTALKAWWHRWRYRRYMPGRPPTTEEMALAFRVHAADIARNVMQHNALWNLWHRRRRQAAPASVPAVFERTKQ